MKRGRFVVVASHHACYQYQYNTSGARALLGSRSSWQGSRSSWQVPDPTQSGRCFLRFYVSTATQSNFFRNPHPMLPVAFLRRAFRSSLRALSLMTSDMLSAEATGVHSVYPRQCQLQTGGRRSRGCGYGRLERQALWRCPLQSAEIKTEVAFFGHLLCNGGGLFYIATSEITPHIQNVP